MGICEVLTAVFIVLKLIGIISWPWFLVLLPELLAFLIYAIIIVMIIKTHCNMRKEINNITKRR